ncbi:hypothetical protein PV325_013138 [Microctonus aethiopoides]|nr:hypothetical protein PV325_013138 [Microctonus aethiopoides]
MSVDIFGRKLTKGVDKDSNRGFPGYGFKVTTDGQHDMANKRLCNVASPEGANNAVSFGTMMTTINHELEQIQQAISSIRNDFNVALVEELHKLARVHYARRYSVIATVDTIGLW